MYDKLAQADQVFGRVNRPRIYRNIGGVEEGPGTLLNTIFNFLVYGAALYALFNFFLAGYAFLSAGNDPKKVQDAWAKIWQSILGLVVTAGALVIGAIVGQLVFGDASFIISPVIPTL